MGRSLCTVCIAALALSLLLIPSSNAIQDQKTKKKGKSTSPEVTNFSGGILFETEGSLSETTCFRIAGRVTSEHFFDDFKRIDDEEGTHYRRGQDVLREFPEELHFSFMIFDFACPSQMGQPGPRRYLTKEMMRTLRFSFYWKNGLELRHIDNIRQESALAEPVEPYNRASKEELPKRYRWYLDF